MDGCGIFLVPWQKDRLPFVLVHFNCFLLLSLFPVCSDCGNIGVQFFMLPYLKVTSDVDGTFWGVGGLFFHGVEFVICIRYLNVMVCSWLMLKSIHYLY